MQTNDSLDPIGKGLLKKTTPNTLFANIRPVAFMEQKENDYKDNLLNVVFNIYVAFTVLLCFVNVSLAPKQFKGKHGCYM